MCVVIYLSYERDCARYIKFALCNPHTNPINWASSPCFLDGDTKALSTSGGLPPVLEHSSTSHTDSPSLYQKVHTLWVGEKKHSRWVYM